MTALWLTLSLAFITLFILLLISIPLAWWIARGDGFIRSCIESIITLPLILPPTVIGFYLLLLLNDAGVIGKFFVFLGFEPPIFKFSGLVIASIIFSLPFVTQPIINSFVSVKKDLLEMARVLGASKFKILFSIILPLSKRGIITGSILGFAHVIGEFGVVIMVGGNIPGRT